MTAKPRASQLVREGAGRLRDAGMPAPAGGFRGGPGEHARVEAEWLLGRLLGAKPLEVYLQDADVPEPVASSFFSQISARASGAPLQYLLGEAEFFGRPFAVGPGVFIPRPETEAVVEAALRVLRPRQAKGQRLLDLGTGSGCIAITLASELPACAVVGVELSWVALCAARQNVLRHGLSSRVRLLQGRWFEPVRGLFDGIVSNPPYVPSAQIDHLPLDVRQEPRLSLDGGASGMEDLLRLLADAPKALRPGGILVLECGEEQTRELARRASRAAWVASAGPLQDLAGRPRGVIVTSA